jgi:hypothetical protein
MTPRGIARRGTRKFPAAIDHPIIAATTDTVRIVQNR